MAFVLDTIQWKHLVITIVLFRNFRNLVFIFIKTVMETQLLTALCQVTSHFIVGLFLSNSTTVVVQAETYITMTAALWQLS